MSIRFVVSILIFTVSHFAFADTENYATCNSEKFVYEINLNRDDSTFTITYRDDQGIRSDDSFRVDDSFSSKVQLVLIGEILSQENCMGGSCPTPKFTLYINKIIPSESGLLVYSEAFDAKKGERVPVSQRDNLDCTIHSLVSEN